MFQVFWYCLKVYFSIWFNLGYISSNQRRCFHGYFYYIAPKKISLEWREIMNWKRKCIYLYEWSESKLLCGHIYLSAHVDRHALFTARTVSRTQPVWKLFIWFYMQCSTSVYDSEILARINSNDDSQGKFTLPCWSCNVLVNKTRNFPSPLN